MYVDIDPRLNSTHLRQWPNRPCMTLSSMLDSEKLRKKRIRKKTLRFSLQKAPKRPSLRLLWSMYVDIDPETELNTPSTVAKQALYDSFQHVGFRKTSRKT